jgi:hypothetical protein
MIRSLPPTEGPNLGEVVPYPCLFAIESTYARFPQNPLRGQIGEGDPPSVSPPNQYARGAFPCNSEGVTYESRAGSLHARSGGSELLSVSSNNLECNSDNGNWSQFLDSTTQASNANIQTQHNYFYIGIVVADGAGGYIDHRPVGNPSERYDEHNSSFPSVRNQGLIVDEG